MILKMDIEGAEWDVLGSICCSTLSMFDQIVIEYNGLLSITRWKEYSYIL